MNYDMLTDESNHDLYIKNGGSEFIRFGFLSGNTTLWGKVGVGTASPTAKFEVNAINTTAIKATGSNGYMLIDNVGSGENYYSAHSAHIFQGSGDNEIMRLTAGGNMGIGTASPDAKLAVNGTIHTQRVRVDMNGWSDYVFKNRYILMPLTKVKSYIEENKHLPDLPSEQEVKDKGIDVGEMLKLQTKKIEELTLYMIEKDKQVTAQNKKLKQQEARLAAMEARLKKLQSASNNIL